MLTRRIASRDGKVQMPPIATALLDEVDVKPVGVRIQSPSDPPFG